MKNVHKGKKQGRGTQMVMNGTVGYQQVTDCGQKTTEDKNSLLTSAVLYAGECHHGLCSRRMLMKMNVLCLLIPACSNMLHKRIHPPFQYAMVTTEYDSMRLKNIHREIKTISHYTGVQIKQQPCLNKYLTKCKQSVAAASSIESDVLLLRDA